MFYPVHPLLLAYCLLFICSNPLKAQVSGATEPVFFSKRGGLYAMPVMVELSCSTPDAEIRYTLDGSEPTAQSTVYLDAPFTFNATTILRARAFAAGLSPSPIKTHTYFIGLDHSFPVVSLVFEHAAFFDSLSGIYANYTQDLNAIANIEFFEQGADTAAFNQLVEVEIQGMGSTALPQKSLEIKAKNALGPGNIPYALFPDLPFEDYKRFVLRNGGQDWCVLQFRDEFATSLLSDRSDLGGILQAPELYLQAWRPSVVYLNSQYWGIHNMRERMNRFYVRQHFDWEEDTFDMIENYGDVSSGDSVAWFQLFNYLWQTQIGFEDDGAFEYLKERIDYQNFLDYCVFNIYLENEDWPGNNVLRFRHRSENGKWRWMTYDLDFTFGLYQPNGGWNTGDPSPNALARLLDDSSPVWPNPDWATLLFRRCWQNGSFRRDFANRLADMLNTAFLPQRVSDRLDEFRALYQPEITRHYERWWLGNYDTLWLQNIEKTRCFGQKRPAFAMQEILTAMSEAYGLAELTVNVSPPGGGKIEVNTVRPNNAQLPWKGTYFKGVPLPVKAVANPGYVFTGWSKPGLGTVDSVGLLLADSMLLVAHFQPIDTASLHLSALVPMSLRVYPNPASDNLTVCSEMLKHGDAQVQVFDGLGQMLSHASSPADAEGCIYIEATGLSAGFYYLKLMEKSGKTVIRGFYVGS